LLDDDDEHDMVFKANASGAITIVAECFPFEQGSSFVLTKDNHTSMHGVRHFADERGASTKHVAVTEDLLIWGKSMNRALQAGDSTKYNLLAYPAQSNAATGARHDLKWVKAAQDEGFLVLLDVAAYVPTNRLHLSSSSLCRPDFMCMSFYKNFGHPIGIGCLLAKRSALAKLVPTGLC
jgi:selenocysteine lyase/cysteine desulfurase